MKKYGYDHYMRTHRAVDYHSLLASVEVSMESDCRYHKKEYYGRYSDEFNRLANLSGYIYTDLEHVPCVLSEHLPYRRHNLCGEDDVKGSGILWFNYATAWLPDSNLFIALENEDEYGILPDRPDDIWTVDYTVRRKRQNLVARLPKDQLLMLMLSVCGMIVKVAELRESMNTLVGLIDELEALQNVIVKEDGAVVYHPAAQL